MPSRFHQLPPTLVSRCDTSPFPSAFVLQPNGPSPSPRRLLSHLRIQANPSNSHFNINMPSSTPPSMPLTPSSCPQTRRQTHPQCALKRVPNAPSKGSNVLLMHPCPQCPQRDPNTPSRCPSCTPTRYVYSTSFTAKTYKYYSSLLPLPLERTAPFCAPSWDATRRPSSPCTLSLDAPHPPLVPVTPLVLHVILGQHCRSLPSACPMTHWTPLFVVRVKAMSLLISRVPVTHPILCVIS